jgi:hypothetical protein
MSLTDTAIDGRFSVNVSLCPEWIRHGTGGKGRLEIRYNSLDELDGILEHIK